MQCTWTTSATNPTIVRAPVSYDTVMGKPYNNGNIGHIHFQTGINCNLLGYKVMAMYGAKRGLPNHEANNMAVTRLGLSLFPKVCNSGFFTLVIDLCSQVLLHSCA